MGSPRAERSGDGSQRRAALVGAGLELLGDGPLEAVDAPAVARRAGVSKALVYYYFPTHRDLQVAVVRAAADELLAALASVPAATPVEELTAGIRRGIDHIERQPQVYLTLNRAAAFSPQLTEVFDYARSGVVALLAAGLGMGEPTPSQRLCLRAWLALVEEAILHWIRAGRPVPREELVLWCRDVALHVLASPMAAPVAAVDAAGA